MFRLEVFLPFAYFLVIDLLVTFYSVYFKVILFFASLCTLLLQMLCAWDIREHALVQMVTVKFPFSQRQPDFAATVLSLLPSSTALTLTCNEYIAVYRLGLGRSSRNNLYPTSHSQPVTAALYDSYLHQVVKVAMNKQIREREREKGKERERDRERGGGRERSESEERKRERERERKRERKGKSERGREREREREREQCKVT